jgi:hypothetical protein
MAGGRRVAPARPSPPAREESESAAWRAPFRGRPLIRPAVGWRPVLSPSKILIRETKLIRARHFDAGQARCRAACGCRRRRAGRLLSSRFRAVAGPPALWLPSAAAGPSRQARARRGADRPDSSRSPPPVTVMFDFARAAAATAAASAAQYAAGAARNIKLAPRQTDSPRRPQPGGLACVRPPAGRPPPPPRRPPELARSLAGPAGVDF